MTEYQLNKTLTLTASVIPQENITITKYEWKIKDLFVLNNINPVTISTNDLNIGDNIVSLRVLNSCGSWSEGYENH